MFFPPDCRAVIFTGVAKKQYPSEVIQTGYMFEEGIALLMLKEGDQDPLPKPQTHERENSKISQSAFETVLH